MALEKPDSSTFKYKDIFCVFLARIWENESKNTGENEELPKKLVHCRHHALVEVRPP